MDIEHIRCDFPYLEQTKKAGKQLIYLDNAATTQKPRCVIDELSNFYACGVSNIRRGIYQSAEDTTLRYEKARSRIALFIGSSPEEIVFTRGATEGINLVATSWGMRHIKAGDQIIVSLQEHHSNFVPWQQLARHTGAQLVFIPLTHTGELDLQTYQQQLSARTKLVAIVHCSNVLGIANDVQSIARQAREFGAHVLVDAAQSIGKRQLNVAELGADFLVFSGHKVLGPTGIGVLFIKKELQETMDPYQVGGGMVFSVRQNESLWVAGPQRFEAGTPPIAQAIGLSKAFDYLNTFDLQDIVQHKVTLTRRTLEGLANMRHIRIIGPVKRMRQEGQIVTFVHERMHAHDVAAHLDSHSIAVRAGHHCAQPFHEAMGIASSVRISFYIYNNLAEVDQLIASLDPLTR